MTSSGSRRPRAWAVMAGLAVLATVAPFRVAAGDLPARPSLAADPAAVGPTVAAPAPADGAAVTASDQAGGGGPTMEYLDATAHADDRLTFPAGGPVTVPLRPGVGPSLPIDVAGQAPSGAASTPAGVGTTNGSPGIAAAATPSAIKGLRREVLGFLPYWELGSSTLRLDYPSLSTIAYFSVAAGPDGRLQRRDADGTATVGWGGWTSKAMTHVINDAHAHGVHVVLTVERFAWTSGQAAATRTLLASSSLRVRLASEIATAVHDRGADGVNLDFEPVPAGEAADYVAFVRQVRSALNARRSGYELTFDATGSIGNYAIGPLTAPGAADAVMIMGYDYRGAGTAQAGSIDPLQGPLYDLTDTVGAYLAQTSASKIILGVPYYGRAWSTASAALDAATLPQTSRNGYSASATYAQAVALAAAHGRHYDSLEQASWTTYRLAPCSGCPAVTRELYYDDAVSLGQRYDMINRKALRGAGIWALGYEGRRPELAAELRAKFISDTTAPIAGLTALPATIGDEGFTVGWQGGDDHSGIAWYDIQVSVDGGAWRAWLSHTTVTQATFQGQQGHGYAFRVRAADGRGNLSAYNVSTVYSAKPALRPGGFATVLVDGVNVRSAPGTAAPLVLQADAGTRVAIMAGPVTSGGLAWFQVALPVTTWGPTIDQQVGVWVAAAVAGTAYLAPIQAPNATLVQAAITGFSFGGAGAASLGPAGARWRSFSPNGDGHGDTVRLDWVDAGPLTNLILTVFRASGGAVGTIALGARGAGAQRYLWDGRAGAAALPSGSYLLQLTGIDGRGAHHAPTTVVVGAAQLARYGVALHQVGAERVAGADRYGTAAALSATAFAPGVPVAIVASGAAWADAVGAAAAAAAWHGPVLLVAGHGIPASVAAELVRLKPARIVIAGGTASVSAAVATALSAYTHGPVTRITGRDRYGTAAALSAAAFHPGVPVAYVASGLAFPDAVGAAAAAAHAGGPLLLSSPSVLPVGTIAELRRLKPARIVVVGDTHALAPAVATALAGLTSGTVTRLGGADRYATAAAIVAASFGSASTIYVASGASFADALAGAALGQPMLLVPRSAVPAVVQQAAAGRHPRRLVALGGAGVVSDATLARLQAALGG